MTDFKGGGDGFGDIHFDIDNDYFIVIIEILMDLTIIFSVPWFHLLIWVLYKIQWNAKYGLT